MLRLHESRHRRRVMKTGQHMHDTRSQARGVILWRKRLRAPASAPIAQLIGGSTWMGGAVERLWGCVMFIVASLLIGLAWLLASGAMSSSLPSAAQQSQPAKSESSASNVARELDRRIEELRGAGG